MLNLYLYVLDFNSFLKQNALYLALGVIGLLGSFLPFFLDNKKQTKRTTRIKPRGNKSEYIDSFGGSENLVDYKVIGSRIEVHLKDYSKLDKEKLKSAGVDGFILMSNKLTLVLKGDANEVYKKIFND